MGCENSKKDPPLQKIYLNRVKAVLLGESYSGKTAIFNNFMGIKFNESHQMTTCGKEEIRKFDLKANDLSVYFYLFDTDCDKILKGRANDEFRNRSISFFVYDISKDNPFDELKKYIEIHNNSVPDLTKILKVLVANKIDKIPKDSSKYEEGKEFAIRNNMEFYPVSAKNGTGISEMFMEFLEKAVRCGFYEKTTDNIILQTTNKKYKKKHK